MSQDTIALPLLQRLSTRLALWVVVIAVILGITFSALQIYLDYFNVQREFATTTEHVLSTLKKPAAQAAYTLDAALADEVVVGLFNYPSIYRVALFDDQQNLLAADERSPAVRSGRWISDWFFSPYLFYNTPLYLNQEDDTLYGTLEVYIDTYPLAAGFVDRSFTVILSTLGLNLLLAMIIFFLFQYLVNRPLAIMARTLITIDPGSPEKTFLFCPPYHQKDELGQISCATNALLESIQEKIKQLGELNEALEERVTLRTWELRQANERITQLNQQLQAENVRMSAELDITRRLQQMVLPRPEELEHIQELDIACYMQPACEVGGDYYDVLVHEGGIKIGIGDVTGHGLESGVLMLMVQMAVRTLLYTPLHKPESFLNALNQAIYANIQRMQMDKVLTLALLDYCEGRLFICGQHEDVLVVRANGEIECIDTCELGFMVGMQQDITMFVQQREIILHPGDGIVLYTDGITEAHNLAGEMYGLDRLCAIIPTVWQHHAKQVQNAIVQDVQQHLDQQQPLDDITLVILKKR